MLEWLATLTAAEISKALLEQVLKLSQSAAEDYVKDFLKDSLKEGVALAEPDVAQKAVATALKEFCTLVQDELLNCDVAPAEIRDRYDAPLRQFLKEPQVKPLLGQAFDSQCKTINAAELARIWQQSTVENPSFPALPVGFDWQEIGIQYLKKVNRIRKTTPELRALLEVELQQASLATQQAIQQQITGISPGFDIPAYQASLQASYGYLKLNTLDVHSDQYQIKLGKLFVEPMVREALPPLRTELPVDLRQKLRESKPQQWAELKPYQQAYWQQPAQPALRAISQASRLVILGDPGAGKSTLLQYLAMAWIEGRTAKLPLLIELREYTTEIAQINSLLDFLHFGQLADWQFDRHQLNEYLRQYPTCVMLDGLDEVLDKTRLRAVLDEIVRFGRQYPKAQIIITSRVIGYNPDRLRDAGFRHFTIQPLEPGQVRQFVDCWYDLALNNTQMAEKNRLKQRLQTAIEQSSAIQTLAESPLLLTMMAILNRSRPLPSERAKLYEEAAAVLLHDWDINYKQLKLPFDGIGEAEKQAMLRQLAYDMQANGRLTSNLIEAERLKQIITRYLREQDFGEPREKANLLIQQLRERNFILCYRGAETYSFVHRTFLEYFCAAEFVYRFEKQRTLSFEQLRDQVFQHWQEESWHEVLRLIAGLIDSRFTEQLIQFLIDQPIERTQFLEESLDFLLDAYPLKPAGLSNLLLAANCLAEVRYRYRPIADKLLYLLQQEVEQPQLPLGYEAVAALMSTIATTWAGNPTVLNWLKTCLEHKNPYVPFYSVAAIAQSWQAEPETFPWLKECLHHSNSLVQQAAVWAIAQGWRQDPETLPLLKACTDHPNSLVRWAALQAIAQGWQQADIVPLLKTCAQQDSSPFVRQAAVEALAQGWLHQTDVIKLLCQIAQQDPFERDEDWQVNPRLTALQALGFYAKYPRIQQLLHRATQDSDEQVREWAQKQILESSVT